MSPVFSSFSMSEGKRPLRRSWHRQKDNIRMDLRETGCKVVDLIHLAQDRDQR